MADTVGAVVSYHLTDTMGVKGTCTLYIHYDPSTTIANIVSEYQATSLLLDAITGGVIGAGQVGIQIEPDAGVKGSAVAGSPMEQTGVFDFNNNLNGRLWGEAVPSLLTAKITGNRINDADTDIVAWVANILTAVTTGHYSNNSFAQLTAVADTFISFRKHRKQLHRLSFETS